MRSHAAYGEHEHTSAAVPPGSADGIPHPDVVTSVIQHRVHAGATAQYETWLQEITPAAQRFPGHQGVNIIRPVAGADVYTIVLHFDSLEHLQGWLASETRQRLLAAIEPLLVAGECVVIQTGLEFWFTPPTPGEQHSAALQAIPPHVLGHCLTDSGGALGPPAPVARGPRAWAAGREQCGRLCRHCGRNDVCDYATLYPTGGAMAVSSRHAWEAIQFVATVERIGRTKRVMAMMARLWTEVSLVFPALCARVAGSAGTAVEAACGSVSCRGPRCKCCESSSRTGHAVTWATR